MRDYWGFDIPGGNYVTVAFVTILPIMVNMLANWGLGTDRTKECAPTTVVHTRKKGVKTKFPDHITLPYTPVLFRTRSTRGNRRQTTDHPMLSVEADKRDGGNNAYSFNFRNCVKTQALINLQSRVDMIISDLGTAAACSVLSHGNFEDGIWYYTLTFFLDKSIEVNTVNCVVCPPDGQAPPEFLYPENAQTIALKGGSSTLEESR